ncbi:hypothetical protein ACFL6U_25965 [Planctomycetota bacterium]
MKNRIQQEIDKTLDYLEEDLDIQVNPTFMQGLNSRMARLKITQAPAYRRRMSYPVVIVVLLMLNLGAGLLSVKARQPAADTSTSPESVLAQEYGLDQPGLMMP